ncbi:MAG: PQQ-binding-like beta-propeller repeat protein [Saprospiraceae bacterium]
MKKLLFLLLTLTVSSSAFAQSTTADWKVDFPGPISWVKLSPAGTLIVKSGNNLCGLSPDDKSIVWTIELGLLANNIGAEDIQMVPASPFMVLEKPSGLINTKLQIINYFDGKILFDSKEIELPRILENYPMFDIGGVLLKTKGDGKQVELIFVDLAEQAIRWRQTIDEKPEKLLSLGAFVRKANQIYRPEPILDQDGQILYPTRKDLFRLDGNTGETRWSLDLKKIEDLYFSEATGRQLYVAFDNNKFSAINLEDGIEVWKKPIKLKGDFSNMFPHKDGFIVVQTSLISKIDGKTGKDMWKKEPSLSNTYNFLLDGKDHFYTVSEDGNDKAIIHNIDLNTGEEAWKKPIKVKAPVDGFEFTPKGLLYLSEGGSNIIDLATGDEFWKKDLKLKGQPVYFYDQEKSAYMVYGNKKLFRIDTQTGDFEQWMDELKFQGKEDVEFIEKRDGGYLLGSSQNFMLIGYDGKVKYQQFFPPHQLSTVAKIGLGALAVAAELSGTSQVVEGMSYMTQEAGYTALGDSEKADIMAAQFEKKVRNAPAAFAISDAAVAAIVARYKATFETYETAFILTSDKGLMNKPIFVKIDKETGKELATFDLKSAEPIYAIDEVGEVLYIVQGKVIESYRL